MKHFFLVLVLFVLALMQTSLINVNFVLIFSLSLFLLENKGFTPLAFFISGLFLDLIGTERFGLYTVLMTSILLLLMILKRLFGFGTIAKVAMCLFAFMAFYYLISFGDGKGLNAYFPILLKNFIAFALVFPFVYKFDEYFKQPSQI